MAVTAAALALLLLAASSAAAQRCPPDTLAVYRAVLSTHWTRDLFPKQYPEFRPPAQWSRLLGRSHDAAFELFSEGRLASTALKHFAEVGKTDAFDVHRQGFDGVMDTFGADAIMQGEGQAKAKFYMDSNHSLVSLVVRMVPSPDWFIGVNSINLCSRDGEWEDKKYLQLTLMDAGTDTGFTFTSPNWPSDPPQPISVITAQYPDHPASSFYYPDLKHLPVIATLQFIKVKVYKLSQEFVDLDAPPLPKLTKALEENEAQELLNNRVSVDEHLPAPTLTRILAAGALSTESDGAQTNQTAARRRLARNKLRSLRVRRIRNRRRHGNQQQQLGENQQQPQREHCVLSEWTDWSACGNSCGTGSSTRRRTVLKRGRQCQGLLEQSTWCSSYTDCPEKFFKW